MSTSADTLRPLLKGFEFKKLFIDRLGWGGARPAIDASVASDEVPRGRPHPDMIHHLMRQCGVGDPARVAKVGDTPADLAQGHAAGSIIARSCVR